MYKKPIYSISRAWIGGIVGDGHSFPIFCMSSSCCHTKQHPQLVDILDFRAGKNQFFPSPY